MKKHWDHFVTSAIDWIFRRWSPGDVMLKSGLGCLALAVGTGWRFDVSVPFRAGRFALTFDSTGGTSAIVTYAATIIAVILIACGIFFVFRHVRVEEKRLSNKKVLAIEVRGLRDTTGSPLVDALPKKLEGHREQVLIDLRQKVRDGYIIAPGAALDRLLTLPSEIGSREAGLNRSDIVLVYGGLAPVPLTFLTGVLLDDEGSIQIMDWDRHSNRWRSLDDEDDGMRFRIEGLTEIQSGARDVILAVSVSYTVELNDVKELVPGIPVVSMTLESRGTDNHWSEEKQRALGQQFLDTAIAIAGVGVQQIHLFLACQNSLGLRFGRLYDKKNLPSVMVYQYERGKTPPYPWGIRMPVSGLDKAELVVNQESV